MKNNAVSWVRVPPSAFFFILIPYKTKDLKALDYKRQLKGNQLGNQTYVLMYRLSRFRKRKERSFVGVVCFHNINSNLHYERR